MRRLLTVLGLTSLATAQSPHAFHSPRGPSLDSPSNFEAKVLEFSIGGNIIKRDTENIASGPLFNPKTKKKKKRSEILTKRVDPGADPTPKEQHLGSPPWFPNSNCYVCPKTSQDFDSPQAILNRFDTAHFLNNIKVTYGGLQDKCVFYTRGLDPLGVIKRSKEATQLACSYKKYSIWHLWSNAIDEAADNTKLNYYDPFEPTNRLHKLTEDPPKWPDGTPTRSKYYFEYFENMSRAMALTCTGKIYLYTTEPLNVGAFFDRWRVDPNGELVYPNIWASTESKALRVARPDVYDLITIDARSTAIKPPAFKIRWEDWTFESNANYRRDDSIAGNYSAENLPPGYEPYDLDSELTLGPDTMEETLRRRDGPSFCINFPINEPGNIDFFA